MQWTIAGVASILVAALGAAPANAIPSDLPECMDGSNNDLGDDGFDDGADYPSDPDCDGPMDERERAPACRDHIDNDADGRVDAGPDPGCDGPEDDAEEDAPACSDGLDNDGDGRIDYQDDAGCETPDDPNEASCQPADPWGCGGPDLCSDPSPPMGLHGSQASGGVLLTWQHPLGSRPVAYLVYRYEVGGKPADGVPVSLNGLMPRESDASMTAGPDDAPIAAVSGDWTSYIDASASPTATYSYSVTGAGPGCQTTASSPAIVGSQVIDLADCIYIQSYNPLETTDPSLNCLPILP